MRKVTWLFAVKAGSTEFHKAVCVLGYLEYMCYLAQKSAGGWLDDFEMTKLY